MNHSDNEIRQYIDIVDQVAIISKTDLKGNITFVNDIFCEIAKYTREELIGHPHNILRHPDMPKLAFVDLWDTIQQGKTWTGKIKNQAKDGSTYHVNAHIFPIFDSSHNIVEYMAVRFLMTEEAEEQRKFKSQVIKKISEEKAKQMVLKKEIDRLTQLTKSANSQTDNNHNALELLQKERKEKKKLVSQLNSYENELANMSKVTEANIANAKNKMESAEERYRSMKEKYLLFDKKIISLTRDNNAKTVQLKDYEERLRHQAKIIDDLKDVIASYEVDIEKLKNGESITSL